MIQKTNMTIDAYLRNAGIKPANAAGRTNFIPLKTDTNPVFSEDLASAISSAPKDSRSSVEKQTGLTIADYLDQATTRASARFFKNSTIHNGSLHPGSLDGFNQTLSVSIKDRTPSASVSRDSSTDTQTTCTTRSNRDRLIADSIKKAAGKYNLPAKLIESVIQAESNFQVDAVSPAGAQGLMQLMPGTARELGVEDPFDVGQNIDGGTSYLRQMMDRFGGDVKLALAAYNAGPGNVEKYNGNVPFRETQAYIERVLKGVSA